MENQDCVGALIMNSEGKAFVQRRSPTRRVFPGVWDIVGGHVEVGETPEEALKREIEEETGWRLRRVVARIADWKWEHDGVVRHETDYIVEVDGNLDAPRLENEKHDAHTWVGLDDLELMNTGRDSADLALRNVVERALKFHRTFKESF